MFCIRKNLPKYLLFAIGTSVPFVAAAQYSETDEPSARPVWVKQKAITEAFRFSVLTAPDDSEYVAPRALKIYDRRTAKLVQAFSNIDSGSPHVGANSLVTIVDANFDGQPDIMLAMDSGGAGPNNTASFYLYDPMGCRFVLDQKLSSLTQVRINRDRTISSFGRGGCCVYGEERYRYIGNQLTLVFSQVTEASNAEKATVTTGRRINGKMKYVTRTVMD